ncbi:PH domain-containing protein [Bacillus sp. NPDC094106]|uniref:PH domain-containing protein n=1 Tax=Bacillus sp. NPDC094106 TaxID=3363949 RepID=UPI003825C74D
MWIAIVLFIACLVLFLMMSNRDMNKLVTFKEKNPDVYQKYKGAFDSQPGDFSMVKMAIDTVEERLLPGEEIRYSFARPRYQNKDINVYILTSKRYIYYGIRLTKKDFKSIPYDKMENIDITDKAMATELDVKSKEEKIHVSFVSVHKNYFDEFYVFLSEKQLNPSETKVELTKADI